MPFQIQYMADCYQEQHCRKKVRGGFAGTYYKETPGPVIGVFSWGMATKTEPGGI